ncbi:hypothetical protein L1D54_22400 [Vibrio brasiliensis]|uniref:hypothetical protein n=1 Tax=Vibrio brasiliensis TaxID=170652 RepID=UPI001EFD4AF2|nr:hypothetical protein [Vibrio brasiliensis]MCG9753194.1 hypothetical protein [Vibrio brasiliensis]MCG9783705.1 hypothetical protein [Vibrio brasiliensis]
MSCNHLLGETCHCNRGEPCLMSYQVDSAAGSLSFTSGQAMRNRKLDLVDEGKGVDVTISMEGSCQNGSDSCPSGYITDNNAYAEDVSVAQCQSYHLNYHADKAFGLLDALKFMLSEKQLSQLPHSTYQVCVSQCAGKPQTERSILYRPLYTRLLGDLTNDCFINVYPKIEMESDLTLSYDSKSEQVSDEQRYAEYFERQRSGTYQGEEISANKITQSFSLAGSLTIKQGSTTTKYGEKLTHSRSNYTYTRNLQSSFENIVDQWRLINGIIDIIKQMKSGTYQNAGRDKVKLVSFKLGKPKVTFKGKQTCELVDKQFGTSGQLALGLTPLFDFKITLDLVLAAAAYFKMEKAVAEIREQAQKLEEKVKAGQAGAYVGAEFFIALSSKLDVTGTLTQKVTSPTEYGLSTLANVALSSDVNMRGGAKVWVVEGAFQISAQVKAECQCALRSTNKDDESKVELVFFHNGIKAIVTIETSASTNGNKTLSSQGSGGRGAWYDEDVSAESSISHTTEKEWQWMKALSEKESPYRTTLMSSKV